MKTAKTSQEREYSENLGESYVVCDTYATNEGRGRMDGTRERKKTRERPGTETGLTDCQSGAITTPLNLEYSDVFPNAIHITTYSILRS